MDRDMTTNKLMVKPLLEIPLEMEEVYNFARTATAKDCVAQTIACQLITTMQRMEMVYEALERAKEAFEDIGIEELSQICYDALYGDLTPNKESEVEKTYNFDNCKFRTHLINVDTSKQSLSDGLRGIANYLPPLDDDTTKT